MAEFGEMKLHGHYPSPFTYRVIWALQLKGIPYDYYEENVFYHKSDLLLQYNPVHKKTPVLVHNGKPLCESMVIVEYIDEICRRHPLLPADPLARAKARFWVTFISSKDAVIFAPLGLSGEKLDKAVKELLELLTVIEEHAMGDTRLFCGERIGIMDIAYGIIAYWLGIFEDTLSVKLMDPGKFPRLCAWARNFLDDAMVKDNLPDRDRVLAFTKHVREIWLASTK